MQKLPVYLYTNLFTVTLDLDNTKGINQIMYQRPITIQKGVSNTVQIQFKNSDQKLVNVSSASFVLNVYETSENRSIVIRKPINVLDTGSTATVYESKGLGEVVFTPADTLDLEAKSYNFAVIKVDDNGTESPAYANTYYGVAGVMEVKNEVFPLAKPSIEVTTFNRVFNNTPGKVWWEYDSGNIRVYPDSQNRAGLHTAAFYLRGFRGTVYLEGTLENSPGTFGRYAIIQSKVYSSAFTGVDYVNGNGLFTNLRLRFIPAVNPANGTNTDQIYSGYFDKVLLRS